MIPNAQQLKEMLRMSNFLNAKSEESVDLCAKPLNRCSILIILEMLVALHSRQRYDFYPE
jgi:hypothetical protein